MATVIGWLVYRLPHSQPAVTRRRIGAARGVKQYNVLVGLPEMVRFNIVDGRPVPNERGRVEILDGELEEAADWWCRATIWLLRQKDLTALAHVPGAALTLRGTAPLQHRGFDFRAKPPTLQLHRHTGFRERVAARTLA